jgi:hypothetical protein
VPSDEGLGESLQHAYPKNPSEQAEATVSPTPTRGFVGMLVVLINKLLFQALDGFLLIRPVTYQIKHLAHVGHI